MRKISIKTIIIVGTIILIVIITFFILKKNQSSDTAGILHKKYPITQEDYWNSFNNAKSFDDDETGTYFMQDVANKHTLDLFSFLQSKFKDMEYNEHMQAVRDYLLDKIRPPEKAEEMYVLYGKYNEYQKELYLDQKRWVKNGTPEEMLENLREIQEFRRQHFGQETADAIFGVEVKSNEYALRKQIIIGGSRLTGGEKEERLVSLRREMWGDQADTIDDRISLQDRYNEKMKIFKGDLAGMSEEEREQKIREFRREIFSPEAVERMENADRQLKYMKQRDSEYSRLSRGILDDKGLTEQEKNRKIRQLHDQIYGGYGKTTTGSTD